MGSARSGIPSLSGHPSMSLVALSEASFAVSPHRTGSVEKIDVSSQNAHHAQRFKNN